MLVHPPLSHVSYFTTRQSPSDLPEHHTPPPPLPPPRLPLRSTLSSLSNRIHFSLSPSTSFHFINLSYLKLSESPARFLLFFFIPACSFHIFPSPADPHPPTPTPLDSPHIHQILPALLCGCSPIHTECWGEHLLPQRRLCQLTVLRAESRSPRPRVQSRDSVPLQDYAELNSLPLTPEVGRP